MLTRAAVAVVGCSVLLGTHARGQSRPRAVVNLSPDDPLVVNVSVEHLLDDQRFLGALASGFPLYMEYRIQLRESRSLWDRVVAEHLEEYVVFYDPVREIFVVEDEEGSEQFSSRDDLRRRVARVFAVAFTPDHPGTYHFRGTITARTLSDEDVDEVFAWLGGASGDSARVHRPGFFTRTARKLLQRVAPLPRVTLEARTADFRQR